MPMIEGSQCAVTSHAPLTSGQLLLPVPAALALPPAASSLAPAAPLLPPGGVASEELLHALHSATNTPAINELRIIAR